METVVVPPGAGEIIGDAPDRRVEILCDADRVHATLSRFAPGREGADLHVHRRHTDLFYVLEGELTVRLGIEDRPAAVPAGELVRVPPMVVHGFRNAGAATLRYVNLHVPGCGFADYLRALRDGRTLVYDQEDPPAEGVRPAGEAVIGPPPPLGEADVAVGVVEGGPIGAAALFVLEGSLSVDGRLAATGAWVTVGGAAAVEGRARVLAVRGA